MLGMMSAAQKLAWIGPVITLLACPAAQQSRPNEFYPSSASQLLILNESEEVICYVRTRGTVGRAVDQLDVDDVMAPGEERSFTIRGTQRLALQDCNRQVIFIRHEIAFDEEGKVLRFYGRE